MIGLLGYLACVVTGFVAAVALMAGFMAVAFDRVNEARRIVDNAPIVLDFEKAVADARLDAATRDRMKARVMEQIREGEL